MFGRKAVQAGARDDRVERNHSLDDMFEGRMVKLKQKPKKQKKKDSDSETDSGDETESEALDHEGCRDIVRPVALCSDPQEFIFKVMQERHVDIDNTDIKIGLDDGQNILKINVQLVSKDKPHHPSSRRASYSDVSINLAMAFQFRQFPVKFLVIFFVTKSLTWSSSV